MVSVIFAEKLVLAFSGKGLIPQEILGTGPLLIAVGLSSAVTIFLASLVRMPTSTTHVSCGSIFGIGLVSRSGQWKTILGILLAWVTTLPLAALIAGVVYLAIRSLV